MCACPNSSYTNIRRKKLARLVVVAFSTKCPLARRLVPTLNELQRQYDAEGMQFIALFPNGRDDLWSIAKYAVETDVMFPVYKDDEASAVARAAGAEDDAFGGSTRCGARVRRDARGLPRTDQRHVGRRRRRESGSGIIWPTHSIAS